MASVRSSPAAAGAADPVRHLLARVAPAALRERLEEIAGRLMLAGVVLSLGGAVLVSALVPHPRARAVRSVPGRVRVARARRGRVPARRRAV